MPDIDNFKIELKELLEKHRANITCFTEMVVDFGGLDGWKEYKLTDGNSINKNFINNGNIKTQPSEP